jgi:PD-(D/E)XK nuclease superfamily
MARALSVSSLRTLHQCPEKFRRRYLDQEPSRPSGAMLVGTAAGAAANATDHHYIEAGEFLPVEETLDRFSDEWDLEVEEKGSAVRESNGELGAMKDATVGALSDYLTQLDSLPKPIAVEREARVEVDGVPFVAYLDREQDDGSIADRKVKGKRLSQADADADSQATAYLAVRQVESLDGLAGEPTGFEFHTMVRQKTKRYAEIVQTERTGGQIDDFLSRIYRAAEEIEWRTQAGNWSYAPEGAWWCGEKWCDYWDACPGGGLLRAKVSELAVRS